MTTFDAAAFVAEAERITNERDTTTIRSVFAPNARSVTIVDGLRTEDVGIDAIVRRWQLTLRFMERRELLVLKRLVASTPTTIVNSWQGTVARGRKPTGIEVWEFTPAGLVSDQLLIGFLDPRSEVSLTALLRLLVTQPRNALAFARERVVSGHAISTCTGVM